MLHRSVLLIATVVVLLPRSALSISITDPTRLAEVLAVEASGGLRPPPELTQLILGDLAALAVAFPNLSIVHQPYRLPDRITLVLTQEAGFAFERGEFRALDSLNEMFGAIEVDPHFSILLDAWELRLAFDQIYNTELLASIYEGAEGVARARPVGTGGNSKIVTAAPPFYTLASGSGDCPSGCIDWVRWYFRVEDGRAVLERIESDLPNLIHVIPEPGTIVLVLGALAVFTAVHRARGRA